MILLVHMLFGGVIAHIVRNPVSAAVLAFFSHYFLDFFPHIEYNIKDIERRRWRKALPQIACVILDFLSGIFLISLFSNNGLAVYAGAFFAILPDGFSVLGYFFSSKILKAHSSFHGKIHYFKNKKISPFWRITSQITAVIISVILLRS